MPDEHISRILKMLEEGKISAREAETLIAALREEPHPSKPAAAERPEAGAGERSSETSAAGGKGSQRSFEFPWAHRRGFPVDLSELGRQVSAAVSKIDPDKILRDMREGGKRWQARMRTAWPGEEELPPSNVRGLPSARRLETRELRTDRPLLVEIENPFGDVVIVGADGKAGFETGIEAWGETEADAEAKAGQVDVIVEETPPTGESDEPTHVRITVRAPEGWRDGLVSVSLRLPRESSVQVSTTFGQIRAEGLTGSVECRTTSGGIVLDGIEGSASAESVSGTVRAHTIGGAITINSKSGDVEADDLCQGVSVATVNGLIKLGHVEGERIEARSMSGDIAVEHVGGKAPVDVVLETVSGDLRLLDAVGNVDLRTVSGDTVAQDLRVTGLYAQTVSGDLDLGFHDAPSGRVEVGAVSGDIHLAIPLGANFRYTLSTRTGRLACDHPAPDAVRTPTVLTGTVGAGAGSVSAKTVSGDITLSRRETP